MALMNKRHLIDKKYEARIPCEGRPGVEHVWIEGHLSTNKEYIIHLCDKKGSKYLHGPVFLKPNEMEKLRSRMADMKRKNVRWEPEE